MMDNEEIAQLLRNLEDVMLFVHKMKDEFSPPTHKDLGQTLGFLHNFVWRQLKP